MSVHLESALFVGQVWVGIVDELPVSGVDFLLGNDIAGGKVTALPVLCDRPMESVETRQLVEKEPELFPVCAVTRAMAARGMEPEVEESELVEEEVHGTTPDDDLSLGTLFTVEEKEVVDGDDDRSDQRGLRESQ